MKAYWIKSAERKIVEVDYSGLADIQRMVGGSIEVAANLPFGDVIYVDEEGLLKQHTTLFTVFNYGHQYYAGDGVLVGREDGLSEDNTVRTLDPRISVADLAKLVQWFPPA